MAKISIEPIKPHIGAIVRVDKAHLCDSDVVEAIQGALEDRGVLVFPQINVSDEEQLAFTDALGGRVNFNKSVPGANASAQDVYKVTLDKEINNEPDYVLGTFFWHVDGVTMDMPFPKATLLSARVLSEDGGSTEFGNLFAAYEMMSEKDKKAVADLRVIHSLESSMRPVWGRPPQARIERWSSMTVPMEHPLVWTHADGRKSLLLGVHADGLVGYPSAHGRAMLWRLQQYAAQPDFTYMHKWQVGDLVFWNNEGLMHRVTPYTDQRRVMHRTSIAGHERPGRPATPQSMAKMLEPIA